MSDIKNQSEVVNFEPKSAYGEKTFGRKLGEASFEGLATFLFICAIIFSGGKIETFVFGMWVILSCFGGISGAHVNPAITLGFYAIQGDYFWGLFKFGLYFVFQLIGCILGALLAFYVVREKLIFIQPYPNVSEGNIFFSEFFFTGTFFFFIAFVCHPKHPPSNITPVNTAIIVSWFYLIVKAGSQLSGAAFNPAVLLTLNSLARFGYHKVEAFDHVWIMIGAEFTGVVVFGLIYQYLFVPFYEATHEEIKKSQEFVPANVEYNKKV
jgi:glycerol uptake facilitator protein